jgi:hypothetical protein
MKQLRLTKDMIARCASLIEAQRQYEIINPALSWQMLVALEPALGRLWDTAHHAGSGADCLCAERLWEEELKPALTYLVGFGRPQVHPILSTTTAYEVAYNALLRARPRCRNCPRCD